MSVTVVIDGRQLWLGEESGRFVVRDFHSTALLDPAAAAVLRALGGQEPVWLPAVEALHAVREWFGSDPRGLTVAAEALNQPTWERGRLAATAADQVILVALAAAGWVQVTANPHLTPAVWDLLCQRPDRRDAALLHAPPLPPPFATHSDPAARALVARNRDTPPDLLRHLAGDRELPIVLEVAANPTTPSSTLARLPAIANPHLQTAVAGNPSTPAKTLHHLAATGHPGLRLVVARNPGFPPWLAQRFKSGPHNRQTRLVLAERADLSRRALSWLERYGRLDPAYPEIIERLAANPASSAGLRRRIERRQGAPARRAALDRAAWSALITVLGAGSVATLVVLWATHVNLGPELWILPLGAVASGSGRVVQRRRLNRHRRLDEPAVPPFPTP